MSCSKHWFLHLSSVRVRLFTERAPLEEHRQNSHRTWATSRVPSANERRASAFGFKTRDTYIPASSGGHNLDTKIRNDGHNGIGIAHDLSQVRRTATMGYHFLDLSKEEKHERRHLLDWYGLTAQASILAPLLTLQLYFLAVWIDRRWRNRNEFDAPSSPPAKREQRGGKSGLLRTAKNASRQILWWNSDPVDVLGCHLGSKGDVLGAAIWTVWLLFLCFPQTGEGKRA